MLKILFVDDNPQNRVLLKAQLAELTDNFVEAGDGEEAMAVLEHGGIDVVITDILMPRMDGYRLCYEIRHRDRLKTIPLIVYSCSFTSPADIRAAIGFGADCFIPKPSPPERMIDEIRRLTTTTHRNPSVLESPDELKSFKEYSETLVRKLEDKNELISRLNENLETMVSDRTRELVAANDTLEAFSYSVSHDLRAPLRSIAGFSRMIMDDDTQLLSQSNRENFERVQRATQHMGRLIDDMLSLARVTHQPLVRQTVDMSALASEVLKEIRDREPERLADVEVMDPMTVQGDRGLLRILLENLIGNAWKFTAKTERTKISIVSLGVQEAQTTFCVKDNGAGFDMRCAEQLFKPFQRLHSASEFAGTGIGLATVHRVVQSHGGRVWAKGETGKGAAFFFSLPQVGSGL